MPEEPIIPVIRRPEKRRGSEGSLDRERRIAREVREGRERFERKSADREEKKPKPAPTRKEAHEKTRDDRKPSSNRPIEDSRSKSRNISRDETDERKVSRRGSRDEVSDESRKGSREEKRPARPVPDLINSSSSSKPSQSTPVSRPQVRFNREFLFFNIFTRICSVKKGGIKNIFISLIFYLQNNLS